MTRTDVHPACRIPGPHRAHELVELQPRSGGCGLRTDCPGRDPHVEPVTDLWVWFAVPEDGTEHLLMVLVQEPGDPEDPTPPAYRPLLGLSETQALSMRDTAAQAGAALGKAVRLRRLHAEALLLELRP